VPRAFVIAIVGAESTGKTVLAHGLAAALAQGASRVAVVPEALREFCACEQRTPAAHEQARLAREQTQRIERAAAEHDLVVADTTALMTAAYSAHYFADGSLQAQALAEQRRYDLTLLLAPDLPWTADGLQRDGAAARADVDAILRRLLHQGAVDHAVINGDGPARLAQARAAVQAARRLRDHGRPPVRWSWRCPDCDDGACERHVLTASRVAATAAHGTGTGQRGVS
jgi:nicotinamide riboside kinase